MENKEAILADISKYLTRFSLSASDVADELGIGKSTVINILSGKKEIPDWFLFGLFSCSKVSRPGELRRDGRTRINDLNPVWKDPVVEKRIFDILAPILDPKYVERKKIFFELVL